MPPPTHKKGKYSVIKRELERFIDSFPEAIYLKHYKTQRTPLSNLSPALGKHNHPPPPIERDGRLTIYNRLFAKGLIERILQHKDSNKTSTKLRIEGPALKKLIKQLGLCDKDGKITLTNENLDKFRRKVNYLTDFDIFPEGNAWEFLRDDLQVIKGKIVWDRLEQYDFPDHHKHSIATTKVPWINEDGDIIGIMGMSRDITGRVEFFYQLCDQFPGCTFVVINNQWQYINANGARMLGFDTPDDLLKKEFTCILNEDGRYRRQYARLLEKLQRHKWVKNHLIVLKDPKNNIKRAEITASERLNEKGQFIGFQGVIIDETSETREKARKEELKKHIVHLKDRTLKELQEIFDAYIQDKPLTNTEKIDHLPPDVIDVYYWIIIDGLSDWEIAEKFRERHPRSADKFRLKKAQNSVQRICMELKIKGGRKGILEYARRQGHI